jgi:hypothetical protein
LYAQGKVVPQDNVQAFAWLDLAADHGDKKIQGFRDQFASTLPPHDVAEGKKRRALLDPNSPVSPALKSQIVYREFSSLTSPTPDRVSTSAFYAAYETHLNGGAPKTRFAPSKLNKPIECRKTAGGRQE